MQVTVDNTHYKFIPSKVVSSFDSIQKEKMILKNDIYEKYTAIAEIYGELIICHDASNMKRFEKKIVRETFDEYMNYISKRSTQKDTWIYNIIDGISEQDSVLYRDNLCVVIPTYTWDGIDIHKLHLLCLPTDTSLRCIRSLTADHISLLNHMKQVTCDIIINKYQLDESQLKIFFHYEPSTYHLHIHFVNISHPVSQSSVEYSHELNSVLFNLSICSNYYQQIVLNKRV